MQFQRSVVNGVSRISICNTRYVLCCLFVVIGMLGSSACDGRTEEDDFQNFLKAIEGADEAGYTPYWLGRNLKVDGITFFGPSVGDFGQEIEGGGAWFSYDAPLDRGGGSIEVLLFSESAWSLSPFGQPVRDAGLKTQSVQVLGVPATLLSIPGGTRPVNQLRLIMHIGDTHVVALANAGGAISPGGPDNNPLIYEDALMAVMSQLRPYPN